jgi:hypothetical protein
MAKFHVKSCYNELGLSSRGMIFPLECVSECVVNHFFVAERAHMAGNPQPFELEGLRSSMPKRNLISNFRTRLPPYNNRLHKVARRAFDESFVEWLFQILSMKERIVL